nr:hypothetical protein [Tanacetum cinerariifolium]
MVAQHPATGSERVTGVDDSQDPAA